MRKNVSKSVQLVLITSLLASCSQQPKADPNQQKVYMRADTTAPYTEVTDNYNRQSSSGASMLLWYMAFRHLGGGYGYASNGLHPNSVAGTNASKANAYKAQRGGFGSKARSASPSRVGS